MAEANAGAGNMAGRRQRQTPDHLTRLAGTINYPTKGKRKRGYVAELVTLHINLHAPAYTVEQLTSLTSKPRSQFRSDAAKPGRNDDQLRALLGASRMDGHWHNSMRAAMTTMIGRGWSDDAIRFTCKRYCRDGFDDPDLAPLIDGARRKWDKPGNSDAQGGAADSSQSREPRFLTLDEWRERDLPMPDYLSGETFPTTCRAQSCRHPPAWANPTSPLLSACAWRRAYPFFIGQAAGLPGCSTSTARCAAAAQAAPFGRRDATVSLR